uniref:Uncharacterized protein n=1 Tax=Anguilla anguilla TaxID=7936 RepID=A0A0E9VMV8_ANGAN
MVCKAGRVTPLKNLRAHSIRDEPTAWRPPSRVRLLLLGLPNHCLDPQVSGARMRVTGIMGSRDLSLSERSN